jgi:TPR repeat protein
MTWKAASIAAVIAALAGPASAQENGSVRTAPAPSTVPAPGIAGPILKTPQEAGKADLDINRRIDKSLKAAGAIPADQPDHAYGAFQRGFFLTAFALALENAKRDDAKAQTLLGELLSRGLGVKQDLKEAAGWYELAAENGDPEAQYALSRFYLEGRGVEKDPSRAATYLEQASRSGQPDALRELAYLLLEGKGREKNPLLAAAYLRRAADAGDMDSQYALAGLFMEGVGVARSEASAARWYANAARNGHTGAQIEYAILLFNGRGIDKDEAVAARWFRQAAESDNPVAQIRLAKLLAEGRGVEKNEAEAVRWYRQARRMGVRDDMLEALSLTLSLQQPDARNEYGRTSGFLMRLDRKLEDRLSVRKPATSGDTDDSQATGAGKD